MRVLLNTSKSRKPAVAKERTMGRLYLKKKAVFGTDREGIAAGIPGSGLICLSVLPEQMGVPLEAIGLVMGIDALVGMFRCMSNCLGTKYIKNSPVQPR